MVITASSKTPSSNTTTSWWCSTPFLMHSTPTIHPAAARNPSNSGSRRCKHLISITIFGQGNFSNCVSLVGKDLYKGVESALNYYWMFKRFVLFARCKWREWESSKTHGLYDIHEVHCIFSDGCQMHSHFEEEVMLPDGVILMDVQILFV